MADTPDHVKDIAQFKADLDAAFKKMKETGALKTSKYAAYDVMIDFHKETNLEILTGNGLWQHGLQGSQSEEVEDDSSAEVPQMTEAERMQKHTAAATQISLLQSKQRTLLSKELYAQRKSIESLKNQNQIAQTTPGFDDTFKKMSEDGSKTRIKACEDKIGHLRDQFCVFENNIENHKEDLDENSPDVPDDLLANWRNVACKDLNSGQELSMTDEEKAFEIKETIREWTKYYNEDWNKDKDDERPSKRARTGTPREFETGDHVMVKYRDKWHHGIVTNYFSTSQAKGNKKIKAGYVVDFIDTKDWDNGLQPKKGKKMRPPDEEEEELFADVDADQIVEAAKEDTSRFT